jgi:hypothetical protein
VSHTHVTRHDTTRHANRSWRCGTSGWVACTCSWW